MSFALLTFIDALLLNDLVFVGNSKHQQNEFVCRWHCFDFNCCWEQQYFFFLSSCSWGNVMYCHVSKELGWKICVTVDCTILSWKEAVPWDKITLSYSLWNKMSCHTFEPCRTLHARGSWITWRTICARVPWSSHRAFRTWWSRFTWWSLHALAWFTPSWEGESLEQSW